MKLIVCDIDKTIIDSPSQRLPSRRLINSIQNIKKTHLVTCATGRARKWAMPILEEAGFTAPCIVGGGSLILDPFSFEVVWSNPIPHSQFENIKNILRQHSNYKVLLDDYSEEEFFAGGWPLQTLLAADNCRLLEVCALPEDVADALLQKFDALAGVTAVKISSPTHGINVQVLHKEATKEHGIAEIQKLLRISKEDTIGIGDGLNDFHIFNAVGTKIAVANAVTELKDMADIIIDDVKYDAVAAYLESLVE